MSNAALAVNPSQVRGREIARADLTAVADLLTRGFQFRHKRDFWQSVFNSLEDRAVPAGLPRWGYLIDVDGSPVGVLILISSQPRTGPDQDAVRCNLSSWYVDPSYRSYAPLLVARALRHRDATYINVSPAPNTRPIVEAQGFSLYSRGVYVTAPALQRRTEDPRTVLVPSDQEPAAPFEPFERDLLRTHSAYGCLSFWCVTPRRAHPFVFRPRLFKDAIPCAQLVYCSDIDDITQFPGLIGRYLLRHGCPMAVVDANGAVPGLAGVYLDGLKPKYFRGRAPPRLGDLAYTEAAMFGM